MSASVTIGFKGLGNPALQSETISLAKTIASILVKRPEDLTRGFVFQICSTPNLKDPTYHAIDIYRTMISSPRALDPEEEMICQGIQRIIDLEPTIDEIREAVGFIVECYHTNVKKRKHGSSVTQRANLFIDGQKVVHKGREEIDIGIDRLRGDWALEMCECTTHARRFGVSKPDQVDFYGEAFRQVRNKTNSTIALTMELVAGYVTGRGFSDVPIPPVFAENNVKVIGVALATGRVYQLA